jgi:multidrug efflux pump subunit AcrA (membrane-fusion protein)
MRIRTALLPARRIRRTGLFRMTLIGLSTVLAACQVAPPAPPDPRLLIDRPADHSSPLTSSNAVVGAANNSNAPAVTYTVRRGALRQAPVLVGQVLAARSAQLSLRGSGSVSAVFVARGDLVKAGAPLVEFALDDESLQSAKAQATLAQLAYETQQATVDSLKASAAKSSLDALRATVERDQAEIQKLEWEQADAASSNENAGQTRAAAQASAARRVALAEVALEAAQDSLAEAQGILKRAQDDAESNSALARADAVQAAEAASANVRSASRRVDEAGVKLAQTKMAWQATKSNQQLAVQQLQAAQDQDVLKEAQAAAQAARDQSPSSDHTARQIRSEIAAAEAAVRAAERRLAMDSLVLGQVNDNLGANKTVDEADVKVAALALEQAKDDLSQAQAAEQRAQEKVQRLQKPRAQVDPSVAQASVRQAEHKVQTEKINLDEALAAQAAIADGSQAPVRFNDRALSAARTQLIADQQRLAELQEGAPAAALKREETRAALLRDQADAAAAAAQPRVVLTAPFDGVVTGVGVSEGQTILPQTTTGQTILTAPSVVGGQTSDGRTVAIQLAGTGANSIVAAAAESDVPFLSTGQAVEVSFPGLPDQPSRGTIAEISSTAVAKDNTISYPVRVEIDSAPPALRLGMTAQVSVNIGDNSNMLLAPRQAVRSVDGQQVVSKVDGDGQVRDVPVHVGRSDGTDVQIVDGLREGDILAVYPSISAAVVH